MVIECEVMVEQPSTMLENFFYESKKRLEPITVGDVAQITAEATGLSKNTVKRICSEGAITGGSFGSHEKRYGMRRKKVVMYDFDRAAIRRKVHEFYTRIGVPNSSNAAVGCSSERNLCRRKDKFEAPSKGDGI